MQRNAIYRVPSLLCRFRLSAGTNPGSPVFPEGFIGRPLYGWSALEYPESPHGFLQSLSP